MKQFSVRSIAFVRKPIPIMLVLTLILMLTGCNFIEEKKAEGIINNYYQAIIEGDYKKAFEQLHLFDFDSTTEESKLAEGTTLSDEETKAFYLQKINVLKAQNYKLIDFEIVDIEYEDGHSFWHHIKLEVEQNGQKLEWNEVAEIYGGKLLIGEKDDPYAKYRDGKMDFEMEEWMTS
ncbi:hypothetical protein [Psychrobacillus sp. NPDC096389]|uniref:hypothetical protein n=1 Tax=Psychrobacillus sp. NPDC096389 TaxID=3364490 RepID=UPI003823C8D2